MKVKLKVKKTSKLLNEQGSERREGPSKLSDPYYSVQDPSAPFKTTPDVPPQLLRLSPLQEYLMNNELTEPLLYMLSTSWCGACKTWHEKLHINTFKHVYVDLEKKFVENHFSEEPTDGDTDLIQLVLEERENIAGDIKAYPTFVVLRTNGRVVDYGSNAPLAVKDEGISRWETAAQTKYNDAADAMTR